MFVLNWLLHAVTLFTSVILAPLPYQRSLSAVLIPYAPSAALIVVAVGMWVIAPFIARLVSRGADATLNLSGVSRYDLYSFAFVFVGLYFVLSSIADTINWLHYFATVSHDKAGEDPRIQNFYQLTRPFLTLAVGLIALFGAPHWAKRLVSNERKQDEASPV